MVINPAGENKSKRELEFKSIAVSYLWDFPELVENPQRIMDAVKRYKECKMLPLDNVIIRVLKRRLSQTREGREIYVKLFNETPPEYGSWFIPPDKLVEMLAKDG